MGEGRSRRLLAGQARALTPTAFMQRLLHFFWFNYHRREGDEGIYQVGTYEIQKWAERHLARHYAVHSTSCITQGRVTLSGSDVLIGHLSWDPGDDGTGKAGRSLRNWVYDNRLDPDAGSHPNTYILTPWVPVFPPEWTESMPHHESQLEQARVIFAICGPIWHRETLALKDDTVQSRVKSKLVRLDMCVNLDALKIRKTRFNPPGKRKLIHVSNLDSYKGFDLLLDSTRGVAVPSIGSKRLRGLERGVREIEEFGAKYTINSLGSINNRDDAQIAALVAEHDFYIHTSTMDAQATTILEFAARGLVPIVTPESGFECEDAITLTRYPAKNRDIIANALVMPEEELVHRAERIRAKLARDHSWDRFFDTIARTINETCVS